VLGPALALVRLPRIRVRLDECSPINVQPPGRSLLPVTCEACRPACLHCRARAEACWPAGLLGACRAPALAWNANANVTIRIRAPQVTAFLRGEGGAGAAVADVAGPPAGDALGDEWRIFVCEACGGRELRSAREWSAHLAGSRHRRRAAAVRRRAREAVAESGHQAAATPLAAYEEMEEGVGTEEPGWWCAAPEDMAGVEAAWEQQEPSGILGTAANNTFGGGGHSSVVATGGVIRISSTQQLLL